MHHFQYKGGVLHAEEVDIANLAHRVGTPFYCYSTATLERHYRVFSDAVSEVDNLICFAIKSNSNLSILRLLANLGSGMDVVSGGELRRARQAGVPGEKIIFSGVGKSEPEMALGLDEKILCFNVESESELEQLNKVAVSRRQIAPISLRVNPDVDPKTHAKISTGKAQDKFGIPYEHARRLYQKASNLEGLKITGVDMHIGSQIIDLQPFNDAFDLLRELVLDLRSDGHDIRHIDVGGGLGIPYSENSDDIPHPVDYARLVKSRLGDLNCRLLFEPGRMIAGNAGILVTRVLHVKSNGNKIFTIVDAAMNDLIRPTLYDAYHSIKAIDEVRNDQKFVNTDIVGPICETGDYLALNRELPEFRPSDLLAVMTAGAYGAVLSGTYNTRPLIPEILVNGDRYAIIRPRQSYEELIGRDVIAPWLSQE